VTDAAGGEKLTETGVSLGTPAYMAPEQALADPNLDHRVDIYAVGVMAYEMLAGEAPFRGVTAQEVLAAQITRAAEPVTARRPTVPTVLAAVVMKCLEKRPADRWQSAEELRAQLEHLATPGLEAALPRPVRAVGPAARREFPRWLAWLAGGALVATGAIALTLRQHPEQALLLGKRAVVAAGDELELWPTLAPDGRTIAYHAGILPASEVLVRQVDAGQPVTVTAEMPGDQCCPQFSPDGTRLLVRSRDGLYVVPALGGQARRVVRRDAADGAVLWGNWSPDGGRILFVLRDTLFRQSLDSTSARAIATGAELHSPAWSPDGKWIAYVEGNLIFHFNGNMASSRIVVVPAGGGTPVPVTERHGFNTSPVWLPDGRAILYISDRDGGRDVYQLGLRGSGAPDGAPVRITTGLSPERISLSADGRRLAWSVYTLTSNVWAIPVPRRDSVALSREERSRAGPRMSSRSRSRRTGRGSTTTRIGAGIPTSGASRGPGAGRSR
jgi:serine/threonine-protein kinase